MATIEEDILESYAVGSEPLIAISSEAADRLIKMMREKEIEDYALRVFVAGGGCSGLQYGMTFDDEVREGDTAFTSHELRVLIDPVSARYLVGATVDYVDTLMGGGFKIDNPNAVSGCGCGHSFRTNDSGNTEDAPAGGGGCSSCASH